MQAKVCDFCGEPGGKLKSPDYGVHNYHPMCQRQHVADTQARKKALEAQCQQSEG